MEGENFESTSTSSVDTQSYEAPASEGSYEGSYESDSSSDGGYDGGYDGNYDEPSGQSGEQTIASATSAEGTNFELYTDPTTGKTEFRVTSGETQAEAGTPEEGFDDNYYAEQNPGLSQEINQYVDSVNGQVPQYTLDEFSNALANGLVDERRVPQEYQKQYADFKIEQARLAFNDKVQYEQQRQAYEAQVQAQQQLALQQQLAIQNSPEARAEANRQFYDALDYEATRAAMVDLGYDQQTLDDAKYDDDKGASVYGKLEDAKAWHKSKLMNELQSRYQAEQAYKAGQQQLYYEINEFTRQAEATEPHFREIDSMLATAWQEMPTRYGAVVKGALDSLASGTCTRQEAAVIQKYYEDTRKLFYARMNGFIGPNVSRQRRRPPMVERAGNGQGSISKGLDYGALRNADARGKKAWLANALKGIEL